MAVVQVIATLGLNDANGIPLSVSLSAPGDPIGTLPATTTVNTDIATLVADGAIPTQGHVNTLNTDWTAYKAALTAYQTAELTGDVTVSFDKSSVTTRRQFVSALKQIVKAVEGGLGGLTP
jgi:hypothetical protein